MGGEIWRTLWEAARRYSTEIAYPAAPFPPTDPETLCVLCQQPLSAEAIHRMKRFEDFIQDDTEREAQEAGEAFAAAARTLAELAISVRPIADSLGEMRLHDIALERAIRRALASARLRRHAVRRRLAGDEQAVIPAAEPFPGEAVSALGRQRSGQYAADLQKAATGDERKALESRA